MTQAQGLPWTALMDAGLAAAAAEAGAQPANVVAACRRVPLHAAMQQVGASACPSLSLVVFLLNSKSLGGLGLC